MGNLHEGNAEYKKSIQFYSKACINDPENNELLAVKGNSTSIYLRHRRN